MNCPACSAELRMMERQGVEIDYCPKCRGVWLDRGELDKIIERSVAGPEYESGGRYDERERHDERPYYDNDNYRGRPHKKHKKREGFLSDLFDFD